MKHFTTLVALALVALPLASAGATSQSGSQSGNGWSEFTTITVTPGAAFSLSSETADFDIFFVDANGNVIGASIDCGADAGTVPAGATSAQISKWDDVGGLGGGALACQQPILVTNGLPATWTYTEA